MKKPEFKVPAILASISAKFVKKPVFNQPVYTEKRYHVTRVLYAVLLALLVMTAAAVIGLKAMTINFIEGNHDAGFEFTVGDPGESVIMAALPRMIFTAPAKLALVAGALSVFVGTAHLAFVIMDWKTGKKTQAYAFRRNMMFLHIFNTILTLFALISIFVTHKSSSHFNARYVARKADRPSANDGIRYNVGTFDLETWSCELKSVDGAKIVWDDYAAQCNIEVAGRGMMIPFLIVASALAAMGIWGMLGKRDVSGERIKTGEVEVEMGKMNAV